MEIGGLNEFVLHDVPQGAGAFLMPFSILETCKRFFSLGQGGRGGVTGGIVTCVSIASIWNKIRRSNLDADPCHVSTVTQQLELIQSLSPVFPLPVAALRHKFGASQKWVYFWLNLQDEAAQTLICPVSMLYLSFSCLLSACSNLSLLFYRIYSWFLPYIVVLFSDWALGAA